MGNTVGLIVIALLALSTLVNVVLYFRPRLMSALRITRQVDQS